MNSFTINTEEVLDVLNENPYCDCGSCGDFGCECWFNCTTLRCKYGEDLVAEYERWRKHSNDWYEMLVALGIENPFDIDIERIKILARISAWNYLPQGNIKDVLTYHFNKLKDPEQE